MSQSTAKNGEWGAANVDGELNARYASIECHQKEMEGMSSPSLHTMTVRVPSRLRTAIQRVADKRGLSVNALVRESLEHLIEAETRAQWAAGFDALGRDPELSNTELYFAAQAETLLDE